MTLEVFIIGLAICSAATSLVTEALKKMIKKDGMLPNTNMIAAACAIIVAVITVVAYAVFTELTVTPQFIVASILFAIFSWIGAMVGYDKVIQTIRQITGKGE